jgi:hypothetical protein
MEEVLETGFERTTPVGDSIARRFLLNHVDYMEAVATGVGGRSSRTADFAATDVGTPACIYNSATLLRPLEADADRVLSEMEAFYEGGSGTVFLWSCWPTTDLRDRGWHLQGHPTFMVRAGGLPLPDIAPVEAVRVDDLEKLAAWERLIAEGYPFPDTAERLPGAYMSETFLRDPRTRMWLVYDEGVAVTAASSFTAHGFVQFSFGVTRPQTRRRGHWAALVRERLALAEGLPSGGIFSDDSRPGAERYGFLPMFRFTLWSMDRPHEGA